MLNFYRRNHSTNVHNGPFTESEKLTVWLDGKPVAGYDHLAHEWRTDACGGLMRYNDYGNTNSKNGWEIDHKNPVANGGSDFITNLQPLQWENNRHKGDTVGQWYCKVRG